MHAPLELPPRELLTCDPLGSWLVHVRSVPKKASTTYTVSNRVVRGWLSTSHGRVPTTLQLSWHKTGDLRPKPPFPGASKHPNLPRLATGPGLASFRAASPGPRAESPGQTATAPPDLFPLLENEEPGPPRGGLWFCTSVRNYSISQQTAAGAL